MRSSSIRGTAMRIMCSIAIAFTIPACDVLSGTARGSGNGDPALTGAYERKHQVEGRGAGNSRRRSAATDYLRIKSFDGDTFEFCLDTTGHNASMCNLSGKAQRVDRNVFVFRDAPASPACVVSFKVTPSLISIDRAEGPCQRRYCGARAEFVGATFARARKIASNKPCIGD